MKQNNNYESYIPIFNKTAKQLNINTNTFKGQFEGQLKDQLGGLKDVASKIETNALQDQLKGQLSQNSIKDIIGGLNI